MVLQVLLRVSFLVLQVSSELFPYEVHDRGMVLIKLVSVSSDRWSKTFHSCAIYSMQESDPHCFHILFIQKDGIKPQQTIAWLEHLSFVMFSSFGPFLLCGLVLDWTDA